MNESTFAGLEMKLNAVYAAEPRQEFVQGLEKRLASPRTVKTHFWQWWGRDLRQSRRLRLAWTAAVILLLAAGLFATPPGRAWAQNVLHSFLGYFTVTDQKSLPGFPTQAPIPTYMIEPALIPFEPKTTPAADPAQCGPAVSRLTSTPYCLMLNVQSRVGFDLKAFGLNDLPIQFEEVGSGSNNSVMMWYWNSQESENYCFIQGIGDEFGGCVPDLPVPAESVQEVTVGNRPAELVNGNYLYGRTGANWSPYDPAVELRWREGDHSYTIYGFRTTWPIDAASKKAIRTEMSQRLISFGENLVSLSSGSRGMAGKVDLTPEERMGFHILAPASLPEGFEFARVSYGMLDIRLKGTIEISYEFMKNGYFGGGITLYEGSSADQYLNFATYFDDPSLMPRKPLVVDEPVQIGNAVGRYMVKAEDPAWLSVGDAESTALMWEQNGVKILLKPYYASSIFGGRFTKAELIAIAESLK